MTDLKKQDGLIPANEFAQRYFDYQMGKADPSPYEFAKNMLLVQNSISNDKDTNFAVNKIYAKMQPNQKDTVSRTLANSSYCDDFMRDLVSKHEQVLGHDIDPAVLRDGLEMDLDQSVASACSGLQTTTPIQDVRNLAKRSGADTDSIRPIVSSAILDMGQYKHDCEAGMSPSDRGMFRYNNTDYRVDHDAIDVIDQNNDCYHFAGKSAHDIMRSAVDHHSMHSAVDDCLSRSDGNMTKLPNEIERISGISDAIPDVTIGQERFDLRSLSDLIKSRGTELIDTSGRDLSFSDDSRSWKISKSSLSDTIQAGIPVGRSSIPVFDFKMSSDKGASIENVYIPDITSKERASFSDSVKNCIDKSYSKCGITFDNLSETPAYSERALPIDTISMSDPSCDIEFS